jgi:hypothetical protein
MREEIAEVSHEIWAHWMNYLFSQCISDDGAMIIPERFVLRWTRQMNTPYSKLSEKEKESDRHQADKILGAIREDSLDYRRGDD